MTVQRSAGKWQLRCLVRRKWVALEPEEWVRQHIVAALVHSGWPLGRMVLGAPCPVWSGLWTRGHRVF